MITNKKELLELSQTTQVVKRVSQYEINRQRAQALLRQTLLNLEGNTSTTSLPKVSVWIR